MPSTNLIGQAMQRTSQTIHGSAEGQVGVRQGTTHQVAGVGTDITSFVVTVTLEKHNYNSKHVGIYYISTLSDKRCLYDTAVQSLTDIGRVDICLPFVQTLYLRTPPFAV